jgi:hypothetical protein
VELPLILHEVQRQGLIHSARLANHRRKHGLTREPIWANWQGRKVVAIGSQIAIQPPDRPWRTFHEFLFDEARGLFGPAWAEAEKTKPLAAQHQVYRMNAKYPFGPGGRRYVSTATCRIITRLLHQAPANRSWRVRVEPGGTSAAIVRSPGMIIGVIPAPSGKRLTPAAFHVRVSVDRASAGSGRPKESAAFFSLVETAPIPHRPSAAACASRPEVRSRRSQIDQRLRRRLSKPTNLLPQRPYLGRQHGHVVDLHLRVHYRTSPRIPQGTCTQHTKSCSRAPDGIAGSLSPVSAPCAGHEPTIVSFPGFAPSPSLLDFGITAEGFIGQPGDRTHHATTASRESAGQASDRTCLLDRSITTVEASPPRSAGA